MGAGSVEALKPTACLAYQGVMWSRRVCSGIGELAAAAMVATGSPPVRAEQVMIALFSNQAELAVLVAPFLARP